MVDILVDSITTIKLVVLATIVKVHGERVTVLVVNNIAIGVEHDRCRLCQFRTCRALVAYPQVGTNVAGSRVRVTIFIGPVVLRVLLTIDGLEVTIVVVVVSINALELETIDTTQSITNLHTAEHLTIIVLDISVVRSQHRSVHIGDSVQVLRDIGTEVHAELTHLEEVAR